MEAGSAIARSSIDRVVVATEDDPLLRDLVAPWVNEAIPAGELGLPAADAAGDTFSASAALKARAAARAAGLPAFAGDSGLVVHALGGAPGVWSARWARSGAAFERSLAKIHDAVGERLDDEPTAALVFAVALAWPDGYSEALEARLDGRVLRRPAAGKPVGWGAVFVPHGHDVPLCDLPEALRRELDPRARVVRRLADAWLRGAA